MPWALPQATYSLRSLIEGVRSLRGRLADTSLSQAEEKTIYSVYGEK